MKTTRSLLIAIAVAVLVVGACVSAYHMMGRLLDPSKLRVQQKEAIDSIPPMAAPVDPKPPKVEPPNPVVEPEPPATAKPPVTPPSEGYGRRGGRGGKDPPPEKPPP